ncbi:MAG: hypothetical protein H6817_02585 [Phycisphaerales bacterium]|nr:hypothetical protein [Phycisphaerales bacterium]
MDRQTRPSKLGRSVHITISASLIPGAHVIGSTTDLAQTDKLMCAFDGPDDLAAWDLQATGEAE